ncbi:unnamed protein product [Porites lobata]|uniref:Uncharacterized protein n=1 Tax=Porites lobata TaxID=104759 RepID=A0ABN8Q5J8_9CNID|nr:unnamed protein product [Porites lobata]
MKGRRPSTRSTSSRASLADSTGRKMLSEVLLVCELMMFITLSALTGGTPQLASTDSQKKQPKKYTTSQLRYLHEGDPASRPLLFGWLLIWGTCVDIEMALQLEKTNFAVAEGLFLKF